MYGKDITHYEREFVPFQTYLLSMAYVTESTKAYGNPLHEFTWTIDKGTIVEPIEQVIPPEPPLLPPTLLKGTSFDSFDYQAIGFKFDILALVINGSPPSYASNGSRIHEFIIIDYQKKPTKLTLWEEFIDLYGNKLLKHLKELQDFPVILARKVAKPKSSSGPNIPCASSIVNIQ